MFITNTFFFACLQMRDLNANDSFTQASIGFSFIFMFMFVTILVLVAYRVIKFYRDHPLLSENIKKASDLLLKDE